MTARGRGGSGWTAGGATVRPGPRPRVVAPEGIGGAPPRTVRVGEPVGGTGPSWEEPASQQVQTERQGPSMIGRNSSRPNIWMARLSVAGKRWRLPTAART